MPGMIHTEESLHRLALKSGATVKLGDQAYNAARERVALKAVPKAVAPAPTPAPTPAPAPAPSPVHVAVQTDPELTTAVEDLARSSALNASLMKAMLIALQSLQPADERPRRWTAKISRDHNGFMETVNFEAQE